MEKVRNEIKSRDLRGLAQASGMTVAYWRKAIARGEIVARRAGGKVIVTDADFERWLDSRPVVRQEAA